MATAKAIVEPDGRIRLPEEVSVAANLQPGRELSVTFESGVLTVSTEDDWEVGPGFLAGLDRALADVREGRVTRQTSDEEFEAELRRRA